MALQAMKPVPKTIHTILPPYGAKCYVRGAWHKIGANNKVYMHDSVEWIKSSKSVEQLNREIRKKGEEL